MWNENLSRSHMGGCRVFHISFYPTNLRGVFWLKDTAGCSADAPVMWQTVEYVLEYIKPIKTEWVLIHWFNNMSICAKCLRGLRRHTCVWVQMRRMTHNIEQSRRTQVQLCFMNLIPEMSAHAHPSLPPKHAINHKWMENPSDIKTLIWRSVLHQ